MEACGAGVFAAIVFVLMAQKLITDEAYHFSVFYVAILFHSAYTGLICLYQKGVNRNLVIPAGAGSRFGGSGGQYDGDERYHDQPDQLRKG